VHCPLCKHPLRHPSGACPSCGYAPPSGRGSWALLTTVYAPEDLFISSLLRSFGIPVALRREPIGAVQGLATGPLAEVEVLVPTSRLQEARQLLEAPVPEE
jgi:hypothetical protein